MTAPNGKGTEDERRTTVKEAWDKYHRDYMDFHLKEWPDFHGHFSRGGVMLEDYQMEMLGDVKGLKLLDICCACDAKQAFSWANLGAEVTACDISPVAIDIARQNAKRIGLDVTFHVADAQTLTPIPDSSFDIVFATYICWMEDIFQACQTWYRVLKPGGRLLLMSANPVTYCLEERNGSLVVEHSYHSNEPIRYDFAGTPLADRHGGWDKSVPVMEFHHRLSDILNAIAEAGFRLERTRETKQNNDSIMGHLPGHIVMLARKEN